jgi:hypothetical protein
MGAVILKNNAISRLASSLSAGATALSVTAGEGANFPAPTGGDWFPLTLTKSGGVLEVLRCTARSGDILTVTRAQEGTAAIAFSSGDRAELRVTAAALNEFGQRGLPNEWSGFQTFAAGSVNRSTLYMDNLTDDSPDIQFKALTWLVNLDLAGSTFRASATDGVAVKFPFQFDLAASTAYTFGHSIWHAGNFNPANYLPVNAKAADSSLLDGIDSVSFLQRNLANSSVGTQLVSGVPPAMSSASASQAALTIGNAANPFASAIMDFRREGDFAAFFGLDTDNLFKVGGGSFGAISYPIWHDGIATARVFSAQTQAAAGGVGTYAFLRNLSGVAVFPGGFLGGGSLRFSDTSGTGGTSPSGTWRCMGEAVNGQCTVFVRVS